MTANEIGYHDPGRDFERAITIADLVHTPNRYWLSNEPEIRCSHYPNAVVGIVPPPNAHVTRVIVEDSKFAMDVEIILPDARRQSMPLELKSLDLPQWKEKLEQARTIPAGFAYFYAWSNQYQHFLYELFPRLQAYFELERELPGLPIIVGTPFLPLHMDSLKFFGLDERVVIVPPEIALEVDSLFLSSSPVTTLLNPTAVFYQFVRRVRERISAPLFPDKKRLYISRRLSTKCVGQERVLLNEEELIKKLESLGFVEINLENYPLQEKLNLFAHAEYVCGPYGSGLATSVFMNSGSRCLIFDHPIFSGELYVRATKPIDVECRTVSLGRIDTEIRQGNTPHKRWRIDVDQACREIESFEASREV